MSNYYIGPNGSDTNSGLSPADAWKTFPKIKGVSAGDIVNLLSGVYPQRLVITSLNGNVNNYITIQTDDAVIDGNALSFLPSAGLVEISLCSYLRIKGLTVKNSDDSGILVKDSHHLEVLNNHTDNTDSSGIGVWRCDNVKVNGNKVVNARNAPLGTGGGHEESISIATTTNFEVAYNEVYLSGGAAYTGNEAIDCKDGSRFGKVHHNKIHDYDHPGGSIYVDGWMNLTGDIDIYCNYIKNTYGGILIGSERGGIVENIRVYNNVIIDSGSTAVAITNTGSNGLRRNINIVNNTIYRARYNGGAGIYINTQNIQNVKIKNNIVQYSLYNGEITTAYPVTVPEIDASNNLVFGPKRCSNAFPNCVELPALTADPLFIDLSNLDLHLSSLSPAINSGEKIDFVTEDFDGVLRKNSDMGAYAYIKEIDIMTVIENLNKVVTDLETQVVQLTAQQVVLGESVASINLQLASLKQAIVDLTQVGTLVDQLNILV